MQLQHSPSSVVAGRSYRRTLRQASLLAVSLVAVVFLSSCAHFRRARPPAMSLPVTFTPATVADLPPIDPALLQRPNTEHRLGPGDLLELEVVGEPTTRSRTLVGPDGKIYFYVLPGIDVWGLTLSEARASVVRELQKFVREEQPVSLTLRAVGSQRIWVLGRLNRPGVYPMTGPKTLLEAIAEAGGPSPVSAVATLSGTMAVSAGRGTTDEAADLSRSFVMRQGQLLRVDFQRLLREGDLSQNIYLQPDDFVYLPSSAIGSVHVLGGVNGPRALDYTPQLTLAQTIANAGGLVREAYPLGVAVIRGSLSEPKVAVVDFASIQNGLAPDVFLEPQDIVYVPLSPHRVLTRYVNLILDTFARTVGVNEGSRAITGVAAPVGINVPIALP